MITEVYYWKGLYSTRGVPFYEKGMNKSDTEVVAAMFESALETLEGGIWGKVNWRRMKKLA
jgi:hypothetical protein